MNGKTTRITTFATDKPPLLCLSKSTPQVDNTYNQLEANNSPFLNSMLSPLYEKKLDYTAVYDNNGNEYKINENNELTRNDKKLFTIDDFHFEESNVSEEFNDYLAFDIDDDDNIASVVFDDFLTFTYKNYKTSSTRLFNDGVIVHSRVRILNDKAVAVVLYRDDDNNLKAWIAVNNWSTTTTITWKQAKIRTTTTATYESTFEPGLVSPIINIGKLSDSVIGFSIVNEHGFIQQSGSLGYYTAFIENNKLTAFPTADTTPVTVTDTVTYTTYAEFNVNFSFNSSPKACLKYDNKYYAYDEEGVLGEEITFPVNYGPQNTDETVEIDGITYEKYLYGLYKNVLNLAVYNSNTPYKIKADDFESDEINAQNANFDVKTIYSYGEALSEMELNNVQLIWNDHTFDIDLNDKGVKAYEYTETTTTENASWMTYPNVVLDNGKMYAAYTIPTGSTKTNCQVSWYFIESGDLEWFTDGVYRVTGTSYFRNATAALGIRSNSWTAAQNFFQSTVRLGTQTNSWTANPTNGFVTEFVNTNDTDLRFLPGTLNNTDYNYATLGESAIPADGNIVYTPGGFRSEIGDSPFNILYNVQDGGLVNAKAISYSKNPNAMGTLISSWTDLSDSHPYIVANKTKMIYKDAYNNWWKVEIKEGAKLTALVKNRYILVNTTSYWNLYDSETNKAFHFASDYNDRAMFGFTAISSLSYTTFGIRRKGTAINESYQVYPKYGIASAIFPAIECYRVGIPDTVQLYKCQVDYNDDASGIDVYYTDVSESNIYYRYTVFPYRYTTKTKKVNLVNTSWQQTEVTRYNPNILSKFIFGAGDNDFLINENLAYTLIYYNGMEIMLYTLESQQTGVESVFCLQGQFYAAIENKLYSLVYVNNTISEMDAIIDINGLIFIGNTPSIAFFWSEKEKSIFSFTGDANLQLLWSASKLSGIVKNNYYYDESTQSIWIPTKVGLLVLGTKNTFILEDLTDVSFIQFTKNEMQVTNNEVTHLLTYYPRDEYKTRNVKIETSFYGIGANEVVTIDRFDVTLYDPFGNERKGIVKGKTKTLTNIVTESEWKDVKINEADWSNDLVNVSFNPKLIKGKGVRLLLDSPWIIAQIVPHFADQGHSQTTSNKLEF